LDSERDKKLAELLISAQQGNQVAYERFLIGTATILRRYLGKKMEIDFVEDVLQETLLSIHRFLHTYLKGVMILSAALFYNVEVGQRRNKNAINQ